MSEGNPNEDVSRWLRQFNDALARNDAAGAAAMFEADGFWRDLIAFTWNFKSLEGRAEIEAMLRATLGATRPAGWQLVGDASARDGVTEAWFRFQTDAGSGRGHLRLRGDRCWTLLTTLQTLTGFVVRRGLHGRRHDADPRHLHLSRTDSSRRTRADDDDRRTPRACPDPRT